MKGSWVVVSNIIGGEKMYAVARIRNINETLHSGNIGYSEYGYMRDREDAENLVLKLLASEREEVNNHDNKV